MKPHIIAAHTLWQTLLEPSDTAIDATAGNGHDSSLLFNLLQNGKLYVFDIQEEAIQKTKLKISQEKSNCQVEFICGSHASFPEAIKPESVKLIIYNLGYLPGGDKQITTLTSSTLLSLQNALPLVSNNGVISITLYPGHPEGYKEAEAVLDFAKSLKNCSIEHKTWKSNSTSPSLLLIQKTTTPSPDEWAA